MKNKRLLYIISVAAVLFFIPVVAMQLTNHVNWDIQDFIIWGGLLFTCGLVCELVMRKVTSAKNRILVCGFILFALFAIWLELAVGIFGTPFAGS